MISSKIQSFWMRLCLKKSTYLAVQARTVDCVCELIIFEARERVIDYWTDLNKPIQ